MSNVKNGSCLCGEVSFEMDGEFNQFFLCHCKRCKKGTGTAHGANLFSTKAKLKWTSGEDKVTNFTLPTTRHAKAFCSVCGSALPSVQMRGRLVVVPAGSLDCDISIKPNAHIYVSENACWEQDIDKVQKYNELPS
ncbi:GFA family protein [Francisellaceae bacterium]|nr:GFA family protein [Francisellaceae bacterium]